MDTRELLEHLRVFADMGVNGISRDAAWRVREAAVTVESAPTDSVSDEADESGSSIAPAAPDVGAPALAAIRTDIGDCTRCVLHTLGRRQVVFGVGNPNAELMFVGEAPGADEDIKGEPFVGAAGQLLTRIIEAIQLRREDVYIANVIKCRPPGNRNPAPVEVDTCSPFLLRQIAAVRPRVIVCLGSFAAHTLLGSDAPISRLRGRAHDWRDGIRLVPTFHPAYLLRSPDKKREVWEDMKIVRALLAEPA